MSRRQTAPTARSVALDVLRRIEHDGAYANLALGPTLAASGLSEADRRFAIALHWAFWKSLSEKLRASNRRLTRFFLADHNLNYTDMMGMAEGVEVRVPLIDRAVVEHGFSLPATLRSGCTAANYG